MGRMIYYEHSTVTGFRKDEKGLYHKRAEDDFIHQRQQDPILMACVRNNEMASCDRYDVKTCKAFDRWIDDKPVVSWSLAAALPEMDW